MNTTIGEILLKKSYVPVYTNRISATLRNSTFKERVNGIIDTILRLPWVIKISITFGDVRIVEADPYELLDIVSEYTK